MKKLSIAVALLSATVAQAAAHTEQYNYKGNGADGYVGSYSDCGYAEAYLNITAQKQTGPNAWGGQYGWLSFYRGDWCTGDWSYGWADLSSATFSSNGARGATLTFNGTGTTEEFLGCEWVDYETPYCWSNCWWDDENGVEVCEEVCETGYYNCQWDYVSVPLSIDVAWEPTETVRGVSTQQNKGQDFVARYRTTGSTGYGPVVGSVSFDGYDLGDYGWGSCWAATAGQAWVYHY